MTNKELITNLEKLGLHKQAISVYLAVVSHTQLNANDIARKTGLPRSTVYLQSEKLIHQGLLTSNIQNKTKYFTATSPQVLVNIAKSQLMTAESIIPSLRELSRESGITRPNTTLFVGKSAVRNTLNEFLLFASENETTIFSITHHDILKVFPRFFPKWIKKREQLKVPTQIISVQASSIDNSFKSTQHKEVHFLPANFSYEGAMKISGDKILFISLDPSNLHAVQVNSWIISKMCRSFFRYIWTTTK